LGFGTGGHGKLLGKGDLVLSTKYFSLVYVQVFTISIVTVNTSRKDFHKLCNYKRRKELGGCFRTLTRSASEGEPGQSPRLRVRRSLRARRFPSLALRVSGRHGAASGFQPRRGGDTIARAAGPGSA